MKVCAICGRRVQRGRQIARRGLAKKKGGVGKKITGITHRTFKPNLQRVRALVDGKVTRLRVCASCIRAGKVAKPATKPRPPKPAPSPVEGSLPPAAGEGAPADVAATAPPADVPPESPSDSAHETE